jgi:hypothetical protein
MDGMDWMVDYKDGSQSQQSIGCTSREDAVRVARYFAFLYGESTLTPTVGGSRETFNRGQLNPVKTKGKK